MSSIPSYVSSALNGNILHFNAETFAVVDQSSGIILFIDIFFWIFHNNHNNLDTFETGSVYFEIKKRVKSF